ncbi:MAG: hypothetical protein E4H14_12590 [Candidatus Thorarchaeota archaeon]|nr:MAG: hypothetical protein E4H14_12590 [Candidatus Thorarchaeota archaeon]
MSNPEYSQDKKVQKIDSDIRNFETQLQKSKMELDGLDSRMDAEIQKYKSSVDAKREAYEALRGRIRTAEEDWKFADKEYREQGKKKEKKLSGLKKDIAILQKRIKDAQRTKGTRFKELDKEKEKIVDKAKRDKAKEMEKMKAQEVGRVEEEKRRELGI